MTTKKKPAASWVGEKERALFKALLQLDSLEECERFLLDLCTPAELTAIADRWSVARLLDREISYRKIREETGVSTATVTRVARALLYGEDGYRALLDKEKRKKESSRA